MLTLQASWLRHPGSRLSLQDFFCPLGFRKIEGLTHGSRFKRVSRDATSHPTRHVGSGLEVSSRRSQWLEEEAANKPPAFPTVDMFMFHVLVNASLMVLSWGEAFRRR